MKKSNIAIALLTLALLFAGLTACTAQKESTEENLEPVMTPIETSGEVYENAATGIGIVFPQEYIGKYTIVQSDVDMYSVLHNATNALFKEKDPESNRGFLFTIEKWPLSAKEDIDNLNKAAIPLFQTDEYAYFLKRPSPMDCYTDDMENLATKEYIALYADDIINKIVTSAYPLTDTGSVYNAFDDTMQRKDEIPEILLSWNFAFDDDGIMDAKEYTFPNGEKRLYEPNEYILWLEDTFVSAKVYELPTGMYDMELWLPLKALPELEKHIANGTEYNGRMEEMDGQTLVESGEAAEALGLGKATIPGWGERDKTEYPDYDMDSAGYERPFWFAYNPILYIGAMPNADYLPNYEAVLKTLKENMNKSYSALVNVLEKNDYTTERLKKLRDRIDTTDFAAQYDRYFVFTGPYCILWDNVTDSAYFYTFAHGMGSIWIADFNDAELFTPMYFAD